MKILVDFDDTLAFSMDVWVNIFVKFFPNRRIPKIRELKTWDLSQHWDVSKEEMKLIFTIYRSSLVKMAAPCDANFYIFLEELVRDGHELHIVTANPQTMEPVIRYWLREYGVEACFHSINFVENIEDKFSFNFDVMVDDAPAIVNNPFWESSRQKLLVYNKPWNEQLSEKYNIKRVYNWENIYKWVKEYERRE